MFNRSMAKQYTFQSTTFMLISTEDLAKKLISSAECINQGFNFPLTILMNRLESLIREFGVID